MRPELDRLQFIENQLLAGAGPASAWSLQLLLDPQLAADAALQQRLYQGLRAAGRRQLRQELGAIHVGLYGRRAGSRWPQLLAWMTGPWWSWLGGRQRP